MCAERKLAEYRAKKRRGEYFTKASERIKSLLRFRDKPMESSQKLLIEDDSDNASETSDDDDSTCAISPVRIATYILYLILWGTLLAIFVKLEFGLVYCVVSALVAICLNTRNGRRNKYEISAYSVFNRNCESIDGTLKAEQFEREIRFGSASVR